jgi:hypothetical protein
MATLIDWSEVDLKIQAYCSQFQHDTRSMALTHIVLEHLFGLSPDEVDECITDGRPRSWYRCSGHSGY